MLNCSPNTGTLVLRPQMSVSLRVESIIGITQKRSLGEEERLDSVVRKF